MLTRLRGLALMAATLGMGLMAGVFGLYAHTIMRGLGRTDDRTFVGAFQAIDRAIINPLFMLTFLGALVLTGVAALLYLRGDDGRSVLPWVVVALALYLVVFVITVSVHVPLNDDIKAAGDPDRIADLAAVRDAFEESRWVAWNVVRAIATTVAFGCLLWALILHGRTSSSDQRRALAPERVADPADPAPLTQQHLGHRQGHQLAVGQLRPATTTSDSLSQVLDDIEASWPQ